MLQTVSAFRSKGRPKRLCAVRPPRSKVAAIPDEAPGIAIPPLERTFANSALYTNVFPVPPGPSRKKIYHSLVQGLMHLGYLQLLE